MSYAQKQPNPYHKVPAIREAYLKALADGTEEPVNFLCPEFGLSLADENYPKLYEAILAECRFHGMETPPPVYLDFSHVAPNNPSAWIRFYIIIVSGFKYDLYNEDEWRNILAHEMRHFSQDGSDTQEAFYKDEFEADEASVLATSAATLRNIILKSFFTYFKDEIREVSSFDDFKRVFKQAYDLLFVPSEKHPSDFQRLIAAYKWEKSLQKSHEKARLIHLNLDV